MLSTFYTVSINAIAGSGDAAGFVDNTTVERYMANGGTAPTNLVASTNKVRANTRFKNVVEKLQLIGNLYVSNVVATGGNASTAPSSISFTLEAERGDAYILTQDESNAAVTLTGNAAIKRGIARGLMEDRKNFVYPVYDPTLTTAAQNGGTSNAAVRRGMSVLTFNVDALTNSVVTAEAAVTITKIV